MDRAMEIAMLARRYRLLSRRPDLLYADREGLLERVLKDNAVPVTLVDKCLLASVEPIDRVCARAVQILGRKGTPKRELLELLDVLGADRAVAILCALPEDAQKQMRREPEWERAMWRVQDELVEAIGGLDAFTRLMEGPDAVGQPRHSWLMRPGRPAFPTSYVRRPRQLD